MKRIVAIDKFFSPDISDFKTYDTKIIITKLLVMYVLDDNNEIRMLHYHQMQEIADWRGCKLDLINPLSKIINDIPNKTWEVIEHNLATKVKSS